MLSQFCRKMQMFYRVQESRVCVFMAASLNNHTHVQYTFSGVFLPRGAAYDVPYVNISRRVNVIQK